MSKNNGLHFNSEEERKAAIVLVSVNVFKTLLFPRVGYASSLLLLSMQLSTFYGIGKNKRDAPNSWSWEKWNNWSLFSTQDDKKEVSIDKDIVSGAAVVYDQVKNLIPKS